MTPGATLYSPNYIRYRVLTKFLITKLLLFDLFDLNNTRTTRHISLEHLLLIVSHIDTLLLQPETWWRATLYITNIYIEYLYIPNTQVKDHTTVTMISLQHQYVHTLLKILKIPPYTTITLN